MILLWLGELITEYGLGNGISLIIFAGIVSTLPDWIKQLTVTTTSAGSSLVGRAIDYPGHGLSLSGAASCRHRVSHEASGEA